MKGSWLGKVPRVQVNWGCDQTQALPSLAAAHWKTAIHDFLPSPPLTSRSILGLAGTVVHVVLNEVFANTWERFAAQSERPEREFWTEGIATLPDFVWIAEVYGDLEWRMQQLGFKFTYDKPVRPAARLPDARGLPSPPYENRLLRFLENQEEPEARRFWEPIVYPR